MKRLKQTTALLCAVLMSITLLLPLGAAVQSDATQMTVFANTDLNAFPESYRRPLLAMLNMFPDWSFQPMNTGLDWNTVVNAQFSGGNKDRSLIHNTLNTAMRDTNNAAGRPSGRTDALHSPNWYYASKAAVEFYLDPRNWLTERNVFQFELLSYDPQDHTVAAVERFLSNAKSFMSNTVVPLDTANRTYAQLFVDIGIKLNVSPFHLASRVHQEQGTAGSSPLISGTYPGYEGLYNYFNIAASGTTNEEIYRNGLQRASEEKWTTPALAIEGGASFISRNYINAGQDTLYLQKFDLVGTLYTNQYMQSLSAPSSEAISIRNMYENSNSLDGNFVFRIPVFNNMPAAPASASFNNFNINLKPIASGYTEPVVYLDGVAYPASLASDGSYNVTAPGVYATTAIMYRYNASGVPDGMRVWTLTYSHTNGNGGYNVSHRPDLDNLLTYHGFSIRITGRTGIRVKTGISSDTRAHLLTHGLGGFTLHEYGTIVMDGGRMSTALPLVKGGAGVGQGVAYGTNSNGEHMDNVFEHVDGRYRYTSVLTGLPPAQYKTNFAFRGYIILVEGQRRYLLYGPPVSRSIYSLAEQLLATGSYPVGSDVDIFLNQLIIDAT